MEDFEEEYKRWQEMLKPAAYEMAKDLFKQSNIDSENNKKEEEKMKLSDFIKKYGDCEVTEEMEKSIKKKKGKWMPARGQNYCFVNDGGLVIHSIWDCDYTDNYRRDFMRIFKTVEEAERYLEIMKACKEASFEPDWDDHNQRKFYLSYDYRGNLAVEHSCWSIKGADRYYFESDYEALELIHKFGNKDIAKYVLDVEIED